MRALLPAASTPVLYQAAGWQRQQANDATAAGCQFFLPRPIRQAQLERALTQMLAKRENIAPNIRPRRILQRLNAEVEVVQNGAEAVAAAGRSRFDLILMDCQMPEMDGFQATAAIRAAEGPSKRTPIVALTANAMPGGSRHGRLSAQARTQRRTPPYA